MSSYLKTKKSSVSQWEKVRYQVQRLVAKDCNESKISDTTQDTDAVVNIFLSYALTLEVLSQAYIDAASMVAGEDLHEKLLSHIREDKEFIASYKETMGNEMASTYMVPPEKLKFMMPSAEA